ncbi:MAG: NADH-quinone oxidoreductase subunit M, partial [Bacteroidota bacterium]
MNILIILLLLPVITLFATLFTDGRRVKNVVLYGAIAELLGSFELLREFIIERAAGNNSPFLFEVMFPWFKTWNINFHAGVDSISISMLLLTTLVTVAAILVSWKVDEKPREFFMMLTILSLGAIGFFVSMDLIMAFFFLELSVVPKFLLIAHWGSGRKVYSATKLALMLMAGSSLILVGILLLYLNSNGSFDFAVLQSLHLNAETQHLIFPLIFFGFGIFSALFPFHIWVPDGHSSAPTAGSMFLAGISMKLGGYGCIRFAAMMLPEGAAYYSTAIIILSTIAIIYGAFATLMQTDIKYINAYSSVSHCGFVLLGIGMLNQTALTGAVLQMISHGLMTALFFGAIGMIYSRAHTRDVRELGGLLKIMPFIGSIYILVGLCSLGLP